MVLKDMGVDIYCSAYLKRAVVRKIALRLWVTTLLVLVSNVVLASSLFEAIEAGNLEVVRDYAESGEDLNQIDKKHGAALHVAAESGHLSIVEFLLDNQADPTLRILKSEKSPLHLAAQAGHVEIAAILLDRGAELEQKDKKGETAIFSAILKNQTPMIELLIDRGADLDVVSRFKDTPANKSVALGKVEATELLLKSGAMLDLERVVEKKCSKCHGMDGRSKAPFSPNLASIGRDYFIQQFNDYQSGARQHAKMDSRLTGGISESVLVMLADYYDAQMPIDLSSDTELIARGKQLYEHIPDGAKSCANCHGEDGASHEPRLPRIASQNAEYLAIQLMGYRDRTRTNDKDSVMRSVVSDLSDSQIKELASYLQDI